MTFTQLLQSPMVHPGPIGPFTEEISNIQPPPIKTIQIPYEILHGGFKETEVLLGKGGHAKVFRVEIEAEGGCKFQFARKKINWGEEAKGEIEQSARWELSLLKMARVHLANNILHDVVDRVLMRFFNEIFNTIIFKQEIKISFLLF